MKIAELARVSGTSRSTIHYYRGLGLLPPPVRRGPKLHLYGPRHLRRLRELAASRAEGVSIEALQRRFAHRAHEPAAAPQPPRARRRRVLDDARVRAAIRTAAAREFVARGYEAVRVEDVARATGISKTTFYACFPSKADLFVDCLDHLRLAVIGPAERAALGPSLSFAQESRARAFAVLEHAAAYRMMTSLLAEAAERGDRALAGRARLARHRMITAAQPMFERAMAHGQCRRADPELIAYMAWGALMAIADRLAYDDRLRVPHALDALLELVMHGVAPR